MGEALRLGHGGAQQDTPHVPGGAGAAGVAGVAGGAGERAEQGGQEGEQQGLHDGQPCARGRTLRLRGMVQADEQLGHVGCMC
jgi:hypothetical protein